MVWYEPTNYLDNCYFCNIVPLVTKIWEPPRKKPCIMGLACKINEKF